MAKGRIEMAAWNAIIDEKQKPTNAILPSYAQIIKIVHDNANDRDLVITAAGGPPGEVNKGWRVKSPNTVDTEFGFSCMGYEIPAGWGAAMADKTRTPIVIIGDGTYMMMNSDIYSSVLSGHKMIVIIPDNGGFAIINRLQNFKGGASFNNLIKDSRVKEPFSVDFAKHAEAMGAEARRVETLDELNDAMRWAQGNEKTTVLTIPTDAFEWTPGDADWDVGVPQISDRKEVNEARESHDGIRSKQRIGV
jgi:3D-(3,5/4)-trihydroxycyclohexane-1,2-dione acylhydrolase (decyclizing)